MSSYNKNTNQYYIHVCNNDCTLIVHWLRSVHASRESLLTTYTKHHFYELHYVLTGELTLQLSNQDMIISANQFILIPPEQYHEITSFEPDTIKLVFGFDAELTDKVMNKKLKESGCSIHTETNYLRKLAEVLCTLPEEHSADASHSLYGLLSIQLRCTTEAFFFSLLQILITEEIPTEIPDGIMKSSYKQNLIDNMILLIRNNTGCGFISVDDIAEAFHISKRHLDRICVEITGKTSRKILDEERLRYIRTLLSTTQYTLHEIAFLTGFSNEQSLVRFFHRNEGYPPAQYRKKILK